MMASGSKDLGDVKCEASFPTYKGTLRNYYKPRYSVKLSFKKHTP